jgi:hypothetical protein
MNRKRCLVITVVAVAAVLVLASSCTTSANHAPIMASLEPEAEWATPLASVQVVCTASDPDGDELSYNWSASAGEVNGDGHTVTWTAPASEGSYSIAVVVTDGRGGEVMDHVAITVRVNNPPTIASLTADAEWTTPSGSVQVTCAASDPDGDELSYGWTATAGDISGRGAVVNWTAPQELGTYNITVLVKDGHGSSAMVSLPISVATGQPPNVKTLLVTAEHCYLKTFSWGYMVGKEQEYDIECIVSDASGGVSYEWSCDWGEISQGGSVTTWIAPDASTWVTVTVTVCDIVGNMVTETVLLEVVDCAPCTFGC